MDESAFRICLAILEMRRASLAPLLELSTRLVVVGLLVDAGVILKEYALQARDFRIGTIHSPERPSTFLLALGLLGTLLITGGVAGELVLQSKIGTIETEMRLTSDELVALVSKEAGSAQTSAKGAADAASRARGEAEQADIEAGKAQKRAGEVAKQAGEIARSLEKTSGVLFELQKLSEARHIPDTKPLIDKLKELKELNGKPIIVESYAPDVWGHGLCESLYFSVHSAWGDAVDMCGRIPYPTDTPAYAGIGVFGPDEKLAESLGEIISRVGRLGVTSGLGKGHILMIFVGEQNPFWLKDEWAQQASVEKTTKKRAKKK